MKTSKLEQIIELGKKGLNIHEISEKLNLGVKGVYYHLNRNKVKLKDLATKSPQTKAWETRKANKQLEALAVYNNAPSSGLKASAARAFRKEYGFDIKTLNTPKVETVVIPKVKKVEVSSESIKENFALKVRQSIAPTYIQTKFDELFQQNKSLAEQNQSLLERIEALEKQAKKK